MDTGLPGVLTACSPESFVGLFLSECRQGCIGSGKGGPGGRREVGSVLCTEGTSRLSPSQCYVEVCMYASLHPHAAVWFSAGLFQPGAPRGHVWSLLDWDMLLLPLWEGEEREAKHTGIAQVSPVSAACTEVLPPKRDSPWSDFTQVAKWLHSNYFSPRLAILFCEKIYKLLYICGFSRESRDSPRRNWTSVQSPLSMPVAVNS